METRNYLKIGLLRNLNVNIFVDDEDKYLGNVNDAPDDLKKLYYSSIDIKPGKPIKLNCYSKNN